METSLEDIEDSVGKVNKSKMSTVSREGEISASLNNNIFRQNNSQTENN